MSRPTGACPEAGAACDAEHAGGHREADWSRYRAGEAHHKASPLKSDALAEVMAGFMVVKRFEQLDVGIFNSDWGAAMLSYRGVFVAWQEDTFDHARTGDTPAPGVVLALRAWLPTVGLRETGFSEGDEELAEWAMIIEREDSVSRKDVTELIISTFLNEQYARLDTSSRTT